VLMLTAAVCRVTLLLQVLVLEDGITSFLHVETGSEPIVFHFLINSQTGEAPLLPDFAASLVETEQLFTFLSLRMRLFPCIFKETKGSVYFTKGGRFQESSVGVESELIVVCSRDTYPVESCSNNKLTKKIVSQDSAEAPNTDFINCLEEGVFFLDDYFRSSIVIFKISSYHNSISFIYPQICDSFVP